MCAVHNKEERNKNRESGQNLMPLQIQRICQQKCARVILCILGYSLLKQLKIAKKQENPISLTKENITFPNPKSSTSHGQGIRQTSQQHACTSKTLSEAISETEEGPFSFSMLALLSVSLSVFLHVQYSFQFSILFSFGQCLILIF